MKKDNASVAQLDRAPAFNNLEPSGWKIKKIVKKGDYLYAVVNDHPYANKYGYVLHHRIVMENYLKRLLNSDEIVHHLDGNKKNNIPENLQVMSSRDHTREHMSDVGREYVRFKCPSCNTIFEKARNNSHLAKPKYKLQVTTCSRVCRGKLSRKVQLHGKTPEVERAISENILLEYRKYLRDNAEETYTKGSVETIRTSPETVKT